MSNAIIDDLPMTTDPADEHGLATIGDLTIWHQMPFLSAHRLIQLNCNLWSVWDSSNIKRIAEARRLDDTRDWYFPITVTKWLPQPGESLPPEVSWTWSGIWHSTAHEATDRVRPLPPMTRMRQDWRYASFPICEIIASSGGLLLIKSRSEVKLQERRRRARLNKSVASSSSSSAPNCRPCTGSGNSDKSQPHDWIRLMVCNPMTRECKELPEANCAEMGWKSWKRAYHYGVQVHMEVNDEANSYQVILILSNFVAVYKSTTNSWNSLRFRKRRPWCRPYYRFNIFTNVVAYNRATACMGGRLFVAEVQSDHRVHANADDNARLLAYSTQMQLAPIFEVDAAPAGALRLFDVDTEAGQWKLLHEFPLRKFHLPVLNAYPEVVSFDMTILEHVELAVCMGELYAVIPARLHDVLTVGQKQSNPWKAEVHNTSAVGVRTRRINRRDLIRGDDELVLREKGVKHMPLVFYVMQLQGDGVGVDHAVLRIPVPESTRNPKQPDEADLDYFNRRGRMYKLTNTIDSLRTNWFCCEARGSVIWVSFDDYLLSYDVVSRKSTTQIIRLDGSIDDMSHYSYRPSFHMKP